MNFFKSVFSDDPDPPKSPPPRSENPTESQEPTTPDDEGSDPDQPHSNPTTPSAGWGFGGLLKTLQVKSDWIETYRRDLEEFGSGLKKETDLLREAASKAVKDLPDSFEKAQTSLDSIGSNVWKSTAEILAQGKESLLAPDTDSSDASEINNSGGNLNLQSVNNSGRYSRFDAQLRALQCDVNTYIEEPDDGSDYDEWKSGLYLEEKSEEIENLMRENGSIEAIYKRVVPDNVDHSVFWSRYYYRVHRLKQAENVRAELVKRAISTEDEEELSWDVDDEEEEEVKKVDGLTLNESKMDDKNNDGGKDAVFGDNNSKKTLENEGRVAEALSADLMVGTSDKGEGKEESNAAAESANEVVPKKEVLSEGASKPNDGEMVQKSEEKVASDRKTEPSEPGKESDISVLSTQPSAEEDDMGWDEIEDIGSDDEKKVMQSGSPKRTELRKRLSVSVDEDEDLSWDIEDDDEPVKG